MNRNLLMMAAALLLLTSCGGQSKYEKAIADFVQTDKRGTWTDLQFKVIEMGERTDRHHSQGQCSYPYGEV